MHEASLEEVRKLEERRDAEATTLQELERRETALRCVVAYRSLGCDAYSTALQEQALGSRPDASASKSR